MTTKAVRENKYITDSVRNGTVVFTVGAIIYAALYWSISFIELNAFFPFFDASTAKTPAVGVLMAVLIGILPMVLAAVATSWIILLILRRLGVKLDRAAKRKFIVASTIISSVFSFIISYLAMQGNSNSLVGAIFIYVGILLLGLPFTLSLLWVTRRSTK